MSEVSKQFEDVETDHEYDGIREFDNPLPFWWLMTFVVAIFFSFVYWVGLHSFPAAGTYDEHRAEMDAFNRAIAAKSVSAEALVAMSADPAVVAAGKADFGKKCASCHGQAAEGDLGPNLTDAYWLNGSGPKEVWATIAFGQTSKGMPKWRPILGGKRVDQLTAYVLSIKGTGVAGKHAEGIDANGNRP